jgi:hypothetical protein
MRAVNFRQTVISTPDASFDLNLLFTISVAVQSGIHLYIHLLEAGDEAGRAQPFAEQLAQLAPAASHLVRPCPMETSKFVRECKSRTAVGCGLILSHCFCQVHMPSHTFMHTGHFEDAVSVNAAATYVAPRPGGPANDNVYPLHNRYARFKTQYIPVMVVSNRYLDRLSLCVGW